MRLARMPGGAGGAAAAAGAGVAGRGGERPRGRDAGPAARPGRRPRWSRSGRDPRENRPRGPPSRRWARWTPKAPSTCCARRSATRAASCASRRCCRSGALQDPEHGAPPPAAARRPRPAMRFVDRARARPGAQPRGGAAPLPLLSPTRARSCASPRWRRSAPIRAAVAVLPSRESWATPTATCAAPPPRAWAPSAIRRRCRRCCSRSTTSTGACALRGRHGARRIRSTKATPRRCWGGCTDDDATVRRAAVAALGEIGDRAAAGHLAHARRGGLQGDGARGAPAAGRRRPARAGARLRRPSTAPPVACCSTSWASSRTRRARRLLLHGALRRTARWCGRRRRSPWARAASWTRSGR